MRRSRRRQERRGRKWRRRKRERRERKKKRKKKSEGVQAKWIACLLSSKISSERVCNHHELLGPLMEHTYTGIMKCKPYKVS